MTEKLTDSKHDLSKTMEDKEEKDSEYISTGSSQTNYTSKNPKLRNFSIFNFSTREIILLSILGIMGGIISSLVPFDLLIKTWFPLVGGTQLVSGHHLIWLVLGYGFTRKKSAILYVGMVKGFMDFMIGSQWGLFEIVINIYEGFFLIIGFIIIENVFNERETRLGYSIAGGIGNFTQVPLFWYITGKLVIYPTTLFIMAIMFAFLSGCIISGYLGKIILEKIEKAGII